MYSLRAAIDLEQRLRDVDDNWSIWTASEPGLQQFTSAEDIRQWRFKASWQERREVLLAVGRLIQHPVHSESATLTMLHLCIDEAARPLWRVSQSAGASRAHNALEAVSHLWLACREYPWDAPREGWILRDIVRTAQRAMLKEVDWAGRATYRSNDEIPLLIGPEEFDNRPDLDRETADEELAGVLMGAMKEKAVAREDVELLLELAVLANEQQAKQVGSGGLLSQGACETVAERRDLGVWAVRKRASKILSALREYSQEAV